MPPTSNKPVRVLCDIEKSCLLGNFEKRGWVRGEAEDWQFYWANVGNFRNIMNVETGYRLADNQIINHFPNHGELTKKDLMVKNIKRYRKELERDGHLLAERTRDGRYRHLDFIPTTFTLPGDYNLFVEEFRKQQGTWIMKPTDKARGIGIFLITKLQQVRRWSRDNKLQTWSYANCKDTYVVSRYIDRPLLIGGKKFDLRLYVLVTSWRPLIAYKYRQGFCRFCAVRYNNDVADLDNTLIHLTNVSIQKNGEDYNEANGGKWSLKSFKLYLQSTRGQAASDKLFEDMDAIFIHSLKACQNVLVSDKHCFECYGFDIIVDADLKPWLVEVNASPSLTSTTRADRQMKHALLDDILNIVVPDGGATEASLFRGAPQCVRKRSQLGDFDVLLDETESQQQTSIQGETVKRPTTSYSTHPPPLARNRTATAAWDR